jgi:ubiquinol-cytochrome c reductase iron-sulfur subunit
MVAALLMAALCAVGALAGMVLEWPVAVVGTLTGLLLVSLGATIAAATDRGPDRHQEQREQHGPDRPRRLALLGGAAGAVVLTAGALAVPAARRVDQATDRLRTTAWRDGARVIDDTGSPVVAADVAPGELLTVYPEGALGSVDSQAVLVREAPDRFAVDPERPGWIVDGIVVYSKLCTHMACPLGLYEQGTGTLLCPCHQAVFDVLDSGRALAGPARRALPQLPVAIDADGHLVARGDFSDTVGAGFWGRP